MGVFFKGTKIRDEQSKKTRECVGDPLKFDVKDVTQPHWYTQLILQANPYYVFPY